MHHLTNRAAPFLLTSASFHGTLAAARCLGRAGVPVTVADGDRLAPALWSRYVSRREVCTSLDEPNRFLGWLIDLGRRHPGHVLYPTCDELAWLFSLHRSLLEQHFRIRVPAAEAVWPLLDKARLYEACRSAGGLELPASWFPESEDELRALAPTLPYPVLLKPRTQVFLRGHIKGIRANDPSELLDAWKAWAHQHYAPKLLAWEPRARLPLLQALYPEAESDIYSLTGFAVEGGRIVAALGARKLLQRPRRLGVGICFEEAAVEPGIRAAVEALFRQVGYFGVFEVELIRAGGRFLLIDVNPRFYSQMGFDIRRGLALPLYVYAHALGRALPEPQREAPNGSVYVNRLTLEAMLWSQHLAGRIDRGEVERWRNWCEAHAASSTDAVLDPEDWVPAALDVVGTMRWFARHPRFFLRTLVLDRA